jgi:hypothetical protein
MTDFSQLPKHPNAYSDLPTEIPCPWCQKYAYDQRTYALLTLVFIGFWAYARADDVTLCPGCMRQALLQRTLINLLTANVISPVVILWHGILFVRTFFGRRRWEPDSVPGRDNV